MSVVRTALCSAFFAGSIALTACGAEGVTTLTSPGMGAVTEGAARVHKGDTLTIGSMFACLSKAGSVKVLKMAPVDPVGLRVTGWAIRPNSGSDTGTPRATLKDLGFPHGDRIGPNAICKPGSGHGVEFAVQVEKTTSREAGARAWRATYESGGQTKTFTWTLAVRLCNENSADAKPCIALKV